jgi:nitroimidazol reductase NimA-like FMN-containing flavoprotein (pyridoxamine 5'-phosphate oxidase superfamily)
MLGELNQKEIEQVLSENVIGRIGCYADGRVYVVPVTYVYEDGCIIGHTSGGLKIHMLQENPNCCFELDHCGNLANWQSVITLGYLKN